MHGFSLGSNFLVNAEVDSMGELVDSDVGIGTKPSPRKAEIERAQAVLRLEYDVREERRRELEFLEKGGDPLDFKFGHVEAMSVQSTSQTDQHPNRNLTSEAKGSCALTASPHGDSIESSGRLGITTACEPNSADNFDGENEILESDRKAPGRFSVTLGERSSQLDRCHNVKDSEDSPVFHPKKGQAYRRRNRSRTNRDGPRSTLVDVASRGGNGSSMPVHRKVLSDPVASGNQFEMELDGTHGTHLPMPIVKEFVEEKLGLSNSTENLEEVQNLSSKMEEAPVAIEIIESASAVAMDNTYTIDVGCPPLLSAAITEDNSTSNQPKDTSMVNGDDKHTPTDDLIENAPVMIKCLDSEPFCTETNVMVDGHRNVDGDFSTNLENLDTNGSPKEPEQPVGENSVSREDKLATEGHLTDGMVTASCSKEENQVSGLARDQAENDTGKSSPQNNVKGLSSAEVQEEHNITETKPEPVLAQLDVCAPELESCGPVTPPVVSGPSPVVEFQHSVENKPKPLDKAQEDQILEEARLIEAKRIRIAELSISELPKEHRSKCHWDLVLEEMAWLANDFAQERLWKLTAAAQICHHMAFASRKRLEEQSKRSKQKSVANSLAKTVMEFWHSARLSADETESSPLKKCKREASTGSLEMVKSSPDVLQATRRIQKHAVHEYAVRFLQFNCSPKTCVEVPQVTDDVYFPEVSWEDEFTEENLFYAVPHGAMEIYRKSIKSCLVECERRGNIQEKADPSGLSARADREFEDNGRKEDEGENAYYLPGALDISKPSKKNRKIMKLHTSRPYEFGSDFGYGHCAETRNGTVQFNESGKRPANSHQVDPIPTKRMRTASRPRVVGPSGAGPAGFPPVLSKADASSGDTNSFQDDQTTVRGGSIAPRGSEVDSTMKFENHSTFDPSEMSAKPKKKKKPKHQNVSYDQRWQLDSSIQNEQKDLVRKRLDNHQLESNGNGGLFGQHAKKPKLAKHPLDNSFDNTVPMSGSPVASQMSNMSSQTKIIKFIGGRDRGKKGKGLKVSTGQLGSGSPWTVVEDQALVVLVHDMGPNWELVSDAINNILNFKCIFRKPQECKDRHKCLMDRPAGDGADSAEDSGSSQSYPSTLPGIPKGSARQLFRSLHAHVEEDNIKSRFEKIIRIEQQLHFRKKKNGNQDLKQLAPIHGSHAFSLSQVIPNNVNGGVLTPLDLCDTAISNQEPIEYTSSHAGGLQPPNQSNIHPPAGLNLSLQGLQGSPRMGIGNNLASPPSQLTSLRDARHSTHRPGTLPIEEQQRPHQLNSMLPGRNGQAPPLASSGTLSGSDRGVRIHAGGNGSSVTPGTNRSMSMTRPGAQGISSSSVLKSGGVLASNLGGIPSNINAHSGTASSRGNAAFVARDSPPGVRNVEHQRRIISPEMQVQTTQPKSSGVPAFGVSSGFSNQSPSPLPTYPHVLGNPQPHLSTSNHAVTPEQLRSSRENQIKLRLIQRQRQLQQQVQTPLLPVSSPLPSTSQLHSPSSPPITHVGPQPHQQQKNLPGHGRNAQNGPGGRQRQAQEQPSVRQHAQQRQQSQTQPAKLVKGIGRGNVPIHQNFATDSSHLIGISSNTVNQVSEKGDLANLYPRPSLNTRPLSQPMSSPPNPSHLQPPKPDVSTGPPTSKTVQQISSSPGSNQGQPVTVQRMSQQHRQVNSDFSTKAQASNVVRTVHDPVSNSAMTSASSPSGLSSTEAATNALGNEPLPSVSQGLVRKQSSSKKLVSRGHESQWQQAAQLHPPPLEPILPQKKSQQQL